MSTRPSAGVRNIDRRWSLALIGFLTGVAVTVPVVLLLGENTPDTPTDTTSPTPVDVVAYAAEPVAAWDTVAAVEVRTEPGSSAPGLGTLESDVRELTSTGRIAIVDEILWREIARPEGGSGWVPVHALAEARPAEPTAARGIPTGADATADAIVAAAEAGDLEQLAELALDGEFTATFGGEVTTPAELVALWESIGREEVIDAILGLVGLPNWYETAAQTAGDETVAIFVTPRFMHEPSNAENRRLLEEALGVDYVERSIADGQYLGWRMGITADGDWRFFVAGD